MLKDKYEREIDSNDWEQHKRPCISPSHNFPNMLYIPPGKSHIHTCPMCGKTITVTQPMVY